MDLEKTLQERYDRESFISLAANVLQVEPYEPVRVKGESEKIKEVNLIGEKYIGSRNFCILEVKLKNTVLERSPVFQRDEVFKYLNGKGSDAALVAYYKEDETVWKIALVTITYFFDESGKIQVKPSEAKRFWYIVGKEKPTHTAQQQLSKLLNRENSYEDILNAFSIEPVTKAFYQEIANWYFWALKHVKFPNDAEKITGGRNIAVIRFITRIMFIWFMKHKGLIKDELFDDKKIQDLLRDFTEQSSTYYKAILQNLFFATLNTPIVERDFRTEKRVSVFYNEDYMNHGKFRYQELFKNPEQLKSLFNYIPFLNGGLFECLDKKKNDPSNNTGKEIRIDGFSDVDFKQPVFPNFLFFSDKHEVNLNEDYGTNNKKYLARGIINILKSYNFTVEESTPVDQEVALDPELLGKVFENLLASYNPETATTARKATGSYYTPREIVNYMVDESLKEYFNTKTKGNIENFDEKLKNLFSYTLDDNPFMEVETDLLIQSIESLKVIDPAVGSGAFPMAMLQRLVFLLSKLDPHNTKLKAQKVKAIEDNVKDPDLKNELIEEIESNFKDNELDYVRKLYLIQKCLYGVDIQPIAIQIAKLRFFISLLVDQKVSPADIQHNYGIKHLPNLETKLVIANSLIGLDTGNLTLPSSNILNLEDQIQKKLSDYFSAYKKEEKEKIKKEYRILVEKLKQSFENEGFPSSVTEKIIAYDPFNTNISSGWFDPEWMFGIKEGFDIVIANPPYKEISERDEKLFFQKKYKEVLSGHYDLFIFFFKKGIDLLKKGGINTYITPHTFIIYSQFKNLRNWIYNNNSIIEVTDRIENIFESGVVDNSISIIAKSNSLNETKFSKYTFTGRELQLISQVQLKKTEYTADAFEINTIQNKVILKKYEVNSSHLGELVDSSQGITVYAKVQGEKINYFRERKETKNSKPYTKGREIFKYSLKWGGGYIEYGDWLWCPRDKKYFESPKILLRQTSADIIATYVESPFYCIDSIHSLIKKDNEVDLKYILAILNSKLGNYIYHLLITEEGKVFAQVKLTFLRKIPIKYANEKDQKPFIDLVDKILAITKDDDYLQNENKKAKVKEYEKQVDQLVYKLYSLTEEEIKIIEKEIK